jgi:hypothetical protein
MSWIKVDTTLVNKPKVVQISRSLKKKREETLGYLVKFWCLIDGLTEDGFLPGYNRAEIDDLVGQKGFAKALESVNWLAFDKNGAKLPKFDLHNGASAKRRANTACRVARHRSNADCVTVYADEALPNAYLEKDKIRVDSESLPGAGVCTPAREDAPSQASSSRPDIREALGLGGQQEWPEDEVEKWWLWNDARGWRDVVNWRSSLAMWMKRTRPESSEPNSQSGKISAPPAALEMDVSMEVD